MGEPESAVSFIANRSLYVRGRVSVSRLRRFPISPMLGALATGNDDAEEGGKKNIKNPQLAQVCNLGLFNDS